MNEARAKRLEILMGPNRAAKAIDVLEVAERLCPSEDAARSSPDATPETGHSSDETTLRRALIALVDPPVFVACCTELLDDGKVSELREVTQPSQDDGVEPAGAGPITGRASTAAAERTLRFANELILAANRPRDAAPARLLAALALGRLGDSLAAATEVDLGLDALPSFAPLIDVAAHNAFDRGDPTLASRLWRLLDPPHHNTDFAESVRTAVTPKLGRNELCWCASGRKFKACHLGEPKPLAASIQIEWLERKVLGWFLMRGPSAKAALATLAAIGDPAKAEPASPRKLTRQDDTNRPDRTGSPYKPGDQDKPGGHDKPDGPGTPSAPSDAVLHDPLLLGLLIFERGWLETFLHERHGLLPAHEAALLAEWALSERTIYEVVTAGCTNTIDADREKSEPVDPSSGPSLTLRTRTGDGPPLGANLGIETAPMDGSDLLAVGPSPTLSALLGNGPLPNGALLCGRMVHDGLGGRALVGGAFIVDHDDHAVDHDEPGGGRRRETTVELLQRACTEGDADAIARHRPAGIAPKVAK